MRIKQHWNGHATSNRCLRDAGFAFVTEDKELIYHTPPSANDIVYSSSPASGVGLGAAGGVGRTETVNERWVRE